ncbi:MAG: PASTA domain-containing protein [Spirochaetaceae bacterium]|jgi:beta-lactam-binding protein with PASTA domain|nr:PASTA domain-containing protein [Spirochaetaceae bacterium]
MKEQIVKIMKSLKKHGMNGVERVQGSLLNEPRMFAGICCGMLLFMAMIAAAVFFLNVRGAEEVMVPDVRGKDIIQALLELQTKELDARIQLRYSQLERGGVIEQDPKMGAIVKAGRKVRLVVSQGSMVSNVGNYVGRNVDEVRNELKTLFGATDTPLITVKNPVMYQYSSEAAGTILEQDPLPGSSISGPVEMSIIASKGNETIDITMPSLTGMSIEDSLKAISKSGIRWIFRTRPAGHNEAAGTVIAQDPAGGSSISMDRVAEITVVEPRPADVGSGEIAALFVYDLPETLYPMQTTLDVIISSGERKNLVNMNCYGGKFTYPYCLPKGSVLVLSLLNREIHRETVQE